MDKAQVIASVAGDLHASEKALDEAITRATTLVQSMIGSREALNISAVVGADSQARALEAIANLGAARQALIDCHAELAKDHRRLGWGVYAEGGMDKGQGQQRPTGHLRAV
jgi:hypothetical protein